MIKILRKLRMTGKPSLPLLDPVSFLSRGDPPYLAQDDRSFAGSRTNYFPPLSSFTSEYRNCEESKNCCTPTRSSRP